MGARCIEPNTTPCTDFGTLRGIMCPFGDSTIIQKDGVLYAGLLVVASQKNCLLEPTLRFVCGAPQ
jgi:hypothetical protein